jgi:hypothetical protein
LQDQAIFKDVEPIKIPEIAGGKRIFLHRDRNLLLFLFWSHKSDQCNPKFRPVQPKGLTGASVKKSEMSKSEHPVANGGKLYAMF